MGSARRPEQLPRTIGAPLSDDCWPSSDVREVCGSAALDPDGGVTGGPIRDGTLHWLKCSLGLQHAHHEVACRRGRVPTRSRRRTGAWGPNGVATASVRGVPE
ncbi:MAG: hypothetical protein RL597_1084, partial [Pseudomonadota bacterium]